MSALTTKRKRVTVKPSTCPNPLFEQWLLEWKADAASKNSDIQYSYAKALQSLRKYPVKMTNGKECLILKNFGTQLCSKLDKKLVEYQKNHPEIINGSDPGPSTSAAVRNNSVSQRHDSLPSIGNNPKKPNKRKKDDTAQTGNNSTTSSPCSKKKPYVPALRSGPYAILITMLKEMKKSTHAGSFLRTEIQEKAQNLCDSSFTRPDPGSHYTAWSSMSQIIKKGLISKIGNPAEYSLTTEGQELAEKLLSDLDSRETFPVSRFTSSVSAPADGTSSSISSPKASASSYESPRRSTSPLSSPIRNYGNVMSSINDEASSSHTQRTLFDNEDDFVDLTEDIAELPQYYPKNSSSLPNTEEEICDRSNKNSSSNKNSNSSSNFEQLIFVPGGFKIFLLVDKQETLGNTKKAITDETIQELTNFKTNFEVRHLKVGDFTWVARNNEGEELLLPYIVERKRMDDLGHSIKDHRYHEQKFRLRQCGLQNVIYLIEKYGNESRLCLPMTTLHQAIVNTQVVDKFFIKTTNNHRQSMLYLSVLTNSLTNIFKHKTLISCARSELPPFNINSDLVSLPIFQEFSSFSMKNKTLKVRDMFVKHLLQLKGVSVDRATAIVAKYPTPRSIRRAFALSENPESLLSNLRYGKLRKNIGPIISKSICQLYTNKELP